MNKNNVDDYKDVMDFLQGKSTGFQDTEKAIDFLNQYIDASHLTFGFNPLNIYGLLTSLLNRGVDPSIFFNKKS